MVKYDQYIIDIFYEYIPYLYDKSMDTSILELDINYRIKSDQIYNKITYLRSKAYLYKNKGISNVHIYEQISSLENTFKLYKTWGALQDFYNKNKNTFFSNINQIDLYQIDLHGLYQKEASAMLFVIIDIIRKNKSSLKIITGKGALVIYNTTVSVLKDLNIKYKVYQNYILASF